jgi:hypothetical protein
MTTLRLAIALAAIGVVLLELALIAWFQTL